MSSDTPKRRVLLYNQQNGRCFFCQKQMSSPYNLPADGRQTSDMPTLEHKIPRGEGGTNALENLVITCYQCNNIRSIIPFDIFLEFQLWLPQHAAVRREVARELMMEHERKLAAKLVPLAPAPTLMAIWPTATD